MIGKWEPNQVVFGQNAVVRGNGKIAVGDSLEAVSLQSWERK